MADKESTKINKPAELIDIINSANAIEAYISLLERRTRNPTIVTQGEVKRMSAKLILRFETMKKQIRELVRSLSQ